MNSDGSCVGRTDQAGCRGVIRDEHGDWVAGFARHIGTTNNFVAELWGLRDGLMLCCSLNIPCVNVEMDAKVVVDVIQNVNYVITVVSPLLDDCRQLVTQFQQVQIRHCYRQANRCADLLTRMVVEQEADFVSFHSPPVEILNVFHFDKNGLYVYRVCPELVVAM